MTGDPTIGTMVNYILTPEDVLNINGRRFQVASGRCGNPPIAGDTCPAIVVRVPNPIGEPTAVNLQVLLDGNDSHWVTSAYYGDGPGYWTWQR